MGWYTGEAMLYTTPLRRRARRPPPRPLPPRVACMRCGYVQRQQGALCATCADRIARGGRLSPGAIVSPPAPGATAFLIDPWGRLHGLSGRVRVSRVAAPGRLAIRDDTVSRDHAVLHEIAGDWWLADHRSANGTFHNGLALGPTPCRLTHGDLVQFSKLAFWFVRPPVQTPS